MVDDRFQAKGLAEEALEHILRGLKIQGVRKVSLIIDHADKAAKDLCLSFGFQFTEAINQTERRYELAL